MAINNSSVTNSNKQSNLLRHKQFNRREIAPRARSWKVVHRNLLDCVISGAEIKGAGPYTNPVVDDTVTGLMCVSAFLKRGEQVSGYLKYHVWNFLISVANLLSMSFAYISKFTFWRKFMDMECVFRFSTMVRAGLFALKLTKRWTRHFNAIEVLVVNQWSPGIKPDGIHII